MAQTIANTFYYESNRIIYDYSLETLLTHIDVFEFIIDLMDYGQYLKNVARGRSDVWIFVEKLILKITGLVQTKQLNPK